MVDKWADSCSNHLCSLSFFNVFIKIMLLWKWMDGPQIGNHLSGVLHIYTLLLHCCLHVERGSCAVTNQVRILIHICSSPQSGNAYTSAHHSGFSASNFPALTRINGTNRKLITALQLWWWAHFFGAQSRCGSCLTTKILHYIFSIWLCGFIDLYLPLHKKFATHHLPPFPTLMRYTVLIKLLAWK